MRNSELPPPNSESGDYWERRCRELERVITSMEYRRLIERAEDSKWNIITFVGVAGVFGFIGWIIGGGWSK